GRANPRRLAWSAVAGRKLPSYHPELDGLRALAFLAVFIAHLFHARGVPLAPPTDLSMLDGGWGMRAVALAALFALALFFVLSGYLITSLLLHEESGTGRIDVLLFWLRRILRIWPAYFALLTVAIAFNTMSSGAKLGLATFTVNLPLWGDTTGSGPVRL